MVLVEAARLCLHGPKEEQMACSCLCGLVTGRSIMEDGGMIDSACQRVETMSQLDLEWQPAIFSKSQDFDLLLQRD